MKKSIDEWHTWFRWQYGYGCNFVCSYQEGKAGFLLQIFGLPLRSHNFPYYQAIKQLMNASSAYYFEQPCNFKEQTPSLLRLDECCNMLRHKKILFYTGAGLSAASDIATMPMLEQALHLNKGIATFLKTCLFNPSIITQAFDAFCKAATEAQPTPAHYALHRLAHYKECAIITENVDLLQQKTGSHPIFTHSDQAASITHEDLQEVDVLICIGLSHDDCGFIAHYKKANPQGILIALNKSIPNYVTNTDYLFPDDLQIILPKLADALCTY